MRSAPNLKDLTKYQVNRAGQPEVIWSPLYDYATYAAAGQTVLTFFQSPVGQNGKTYADTNIDAAGQLPNQKAFLVNHIEVMFWPGVSPANAKVNTAAAGGNPNLSNDEYAFRKSGFLKFFIGSKDYLIDGPLQVFPPSTRVAGYAALSDSTTVAGAQGTQVDYGSDAGMLYEIIPVKLESNQNFNVTLNWPTAVALPSNQPARVGIRLGGWLIRNSQ